MTTEKEPSHAHQDPLDVKPFTPEERRTIADAVIAAWNAWAASPDGEEKKEKKEGEDDDCGARGHCNDVEDVARGT